MEKQVTFGEIEYSQKRKKQTRRERFFERMEAIVPFGMFSDIVRPFYYVKGNGREPTPLAVMIRMYLVSLWYNLSDEGTEDLLYENQAVRRFVGVDCNSVPDETVLCKFRHLLERNKLSEKIFQEITKSLSDSGVILREGTIVDATIIEAPKSTKNKDKKRDEEMGSTFKNNQHSFGMKLHIGVDKDSGLVHSAAVTPANTSDIEKANDVLHGEENLVCGDAAYIGIEKREEVCEKYKDGSGRKEKQKPSHGKKRPDTFVKRNDLTFQIAKKRKTITTEELKEEEKKKAGVRAKVENIFLTIKHLFHFRKTRYRGLAKNESKLLMLCSLANLLRCSQLKLATV